jgi:hypothetical protein
LSSWTIERLLENVRAGGLEELLVNRKGCPARVMFPEPVLARVRELRVKFPVKSLEIVVFPARVPVKARVLVVVLDGTDGDHPGPDLSVRVAFVLLFVKSVPLRLMGIPVGLTPIFGRVFATTMR